MRVITKQENMFEKFDFENWDSNYKDFEKGSREGTYRNIDGSEFYPSSGKNYWELNILISKNSFSTVNKLFYDNGFIKEKGKYFGWNLGESPMKIGIWYYFDEQGKLIKEINEDKKFGKFGYNDLLKFVANEGYINLKTGENRENLKVNFFHSATSNKKLWQVIITLSKTDIATDLGSGFQYQEKRYFIDGNTGKELTKEELRNYTGIGFDYKYNFPEQKREIYKTYEGKNYTEEEWKAFEQKLWEEFQKKNKK